MRKWVDTRLRTRNRAVGEVVESEKAGVWSVVLVEDERLPSRGGTDEISGFDCPWPYRIHGEEAWIQRTWKFAKSLSASHRVLTVMDQAHWGYAWKLLIQESLGRIIWQPERRGSLLGLLLALSYIRFHNPAGVVIVCLVKPTGVLSDSFCEAVPKALQRVRQIPGRMVGLVVPPTLGGEAGGWNVSDDGDAMKSDAILGFAQKEFEGHSLCGTSPIPMGDGWGEKELVGVLVTHVETIWAAGKRVFPDLLNQLDALGPVLGTSREQQILGDLYRSRPFETISDRFFPFLHSQMEVHAIAANIL